MKNINEALNICIHKWMHQSIKKRVKDFKQSLLFHEEQFHLLLVGVKFTTMGRHKEQGCEQRPIFISIWGFLVQKLDKKYE